ncbi:MAG: exodeoxyribonuclease VII small subunit [Ignavibacteria bacterium]|nr:exodeoxyribonuclease VII small subunit [Bacteroidota bacterium]MSQ45387.1 exodeoxyribonuclease VII small subunit [Ignavibacteria bacterium]
MKQKIKNNISFEDSSKRLEQIISQLEDGKVDLNKSISLYEEGVSLVTECLDILKKAELRINTINHKTKSVHKSTYKENE